MSKSRLTFFGGLYIFQCTYAEKDLAKAAGFKWDHKKKYWFTRLPKIAATLIAFADPDTKAKLSTSFISRSPFEAEIKTASSKMLYPYQEQCARFALSQNRSYIGADPGLGKTAIASAIFSSLLAQSPSLKAIYICPPFLKYTVARELTAWCHQTPRIQIIEKGAEILDQTNQIFIIPDTLITDGQLRRQIKDIHFSLLIIDEAHRFKSFDAKRTTALFGSPEIEGLTQDVPRVVAMSGTPMPNRPMELYPVLSALAPETIDFSNRFQFGVKYCAGFQDVHGWNFQGASNLSELRSKVVGPFMMRVKKADVLKELPEKTRSILFISGRLGKKAASFEQEFLTHHKLVDLAEIAGMKSDQISTWRKEVGLKKVPQAIDILHSILDETDEKVLVFAHHKDVIFEMAQNFKGRCAVVTGDTQMHERQKIVDRFQDDCDTRFIFGNIQALGTGFTMTRATRVVFVEYSWVPAENDQAEDRIHRIGQTQSVLAQYLVLKDSLDEYILKAIFRKNQTIERVTG